MLLLMLLLMLVLMLVLMLMDDVVVWCWLALMLLHAVVCRGMPDLSKLDFGALANSPIMKDVITTHHTAPHTTPTPHHTQTPHTDTTHKTTQHHTY